MLLGQELLGSSTKKASPKGKPACQNAVLGPTKMYRVLFHWSPLADLTVRTSKAESLSIDAKPSIWDSKSAQILLKIKGLSLSLRNRLTTVDLLFQFA